MILWPKTGNLHENADFSPVGADRGACPASVMGALVSNSFVYVVTSLFQEKEI